LTKRIVKNRAMVTAAEKEFKYAETLEKKASRKFMGHGLLGLDEEELGRVVRRLTGDLDKFKEGEERAAAEKIIEVYGEALETNMRDRKEWLRCRDLGIKAGKALKHLSEMSDTLQKRWAELMNNNNASLLISELAQEHLSERS
jgi:hypothetical protein